MVVVLFVLFLYIRVETQLFLVLSRFEIVTKTLPLIFHSFTLAVDVTFFTHYYRRTSHALLCGFDYSVG
jgi:uncharacterized membrane protein YoaT (DUF817 family)